MAKARDRHPSDRQQMTGQWRHGVVATKPAPTFTDEVAGDEVCLVAGHNGQPEEVANTGGAAGAAGSRASGDGARLPPRSRRVSG
jgi:hypothetical protein